MGWEYTLLPRQLLASAGRGQKSCGGWWMGVLACSVIWAGHWYIYIILFTVYYFCGHCLSWHNPPLFSVLLQHLRANILACTHKAAKVFFLVCWSFPVTSSTGSSVVHVAIPSCFQLPQWTCMTTVSLIFLGSPLSTCASKGCYEGRASFNHLNVLTHVSTLKCPCQSVSQIQWMLLPSPSRGPSFTLLTRSVQLWFFPRVTISWQLNVLNQLKTSRQPQQQN